METLESDHEDLYNRSNYLDSRRLCRVQQWQLPETLAQEADVPKHDKKITDSYQRIVGAGIAGPDAYWLLFGF